MLQLLDLGATAHRLEVTAPDGVRRNVLLGFDRRLWDVVEQDDAAATLELLSPDGDQGFPGALRARARFEVQPVAWRSR